MSADFPDPPAFTTGDIANPGQLITKLQQMRDLLLRITGSTGPNKGQTAWEAFGVGGGGSSSTTIIGSGGGTGGTPDLTPPPTPTGFGASAAISNVIVTCDSQTYTAGGGHLFSRVYGATYSGSGPLPTFSDAVLIDTFAGTVDAIAENPATEWHLWLKWVTKANVESTSPAGGTNGVTATTGQDVSLLLTALNGQITQNQLLSSLGTRINLIDAPSSTAGSVNARVAAEATTRSTDDGKLFAQYTVKIDVNGYVSGFGLASTLVGAAPTSAFIVRADSFSIASPSGPGIAPITPFIVRTTSTTINGVVVPVGVYMDAAFIENGTLTNAKIGNLQVDDAKIASANVAKLTAGSLQVGAYIRSTSFVSGSAGWTIEANGNAEFAAASIRGQLLASQIDTRNLTIKDSAGTVIFSAGAPVPIGNIPPGALNSNVTLPSLGQNTYRVVTTGFSNTTSLPLSPGFYVNGTLAVGGVRSYLLVTINRSTGVATFINSYDVLGVGGAAAALASALNALTNSVIAVVYSYDEPQGNRLTSGLDTAMYRCGASRAVYGSPSFKSRSAYILVGIPGCGEGNGAEAYQGTVDSDTNAWADLSFSLVGGAITGVSTTYIPRTLADYNYTGDLNATFGATFGSNINGQITAANATTFIQVAAIDSALINNLRTANYAEDGGGNPVAGAKLASSGTALKVSNNGLQVGSVIFTDYWTRLIQGIDGASGTAILWRGNNDSSTRGGAPNVNCISIITRADQTITGNFEQTYLTYTLTPTSYGSFSDNLDAMTQIHLQFFATSTSSAPFTETYQPMASRTYDGASGIVQGSLAWGWRYGGVGAETTSNLEVNNTYSAYIRVRIANTYGFSATKDLYGGGGGASVGRTMTATTISGSSGSSGGGGGTIGGQCPAPWVKVALLGGRLVDASDLFDGAVIEAVNDSTLQFMPKGAVVRKPAIIWKQRLQVTLADGRKTEWSHGHRFLLTSLEWVAVQDLRPGDHIVGPVENIVASIVATGEGPVVTFQVEGAGTYFAGNLLSHNSKVIP